MHGAISSADRNHDEENDEAEMTPFSRCGARLRVRKFRHGMSPKVCRGTADPAVPVCRNDDKGVTVMRDGRSRKGIYRLALQERLPSVRRGRTISGPKRTMREVRFGGGTDCPVQLSPGSQMNSCDLSVRYKCGALRSMQR